MIPIDDKIVCMSLYINVKRKTGLNPKVSKKLRKQNKTNHLAQSLKNIQIAEKKDIFSLEEFIKVIEISA